MELARPSATAAERQALSYEELIRSHAAGKQHAVERYDAMLWKIRTGYIVALYGALTLLGDSALALPWLSGLIIAAFSVSALGIDDLFLRSRLRVVHAQNALAELAWDLAGGERWRPVWMLLAKSRRRREPQASRYQGGHTRRSRGGPGPLGEPGGQARDVEGGADQQMLQPGLDAAIRLPS